MKNYYCTGGLNCKEQCNACAEHDRNENRRRHFANPFYDRVRKEVEAVEGEQILKGSEKYPEPFNPKSWTGPQLYGHLMQELRDAQVYGVGLLDYIERAEAEIYRLKAIEELYQQEMQHMAKLVEFLNGHYPEVRAGQHCVDAAIELLSKGRNIDLKA